MSDTPPTIEDDGESDYEQEPFGIGEPVTYDEDTRKPLEAPDSLLWKPMGTDTDPLAFLPGVHREHLLPLPGRGDSIGGALSPEYGSKWPNPGHLFNKQDHEEHLKRPMFKDDRCTLNDEGFGAIRTAYTRMQELVDRGYTAAKQLTEGRLMLLKRSIEELGEKQPSGPVGTTTYQSRLHEVLAQSWAFALQKDGDLSNPEEVSQIPLHSTADLHHFESEYEGLDEKGWPGTVSYIQEHARIHLKHSRLTKAEEMAYVKILASEQDRIEGIGPPLQPSTKVPKSASPDVLSWEAPATKKHHRVYDEWTKEIAPLYLVPHINLEDLGNPARLMQFISSRASMAPIHFLEQDFRATYLGRALRILTGPFSLHMAAWKVSNEVPKQDHTGPEVYFYPYGMSGSLAFRCRETGIGSLAVGDMWLGLKAQEITYRFHHRLCLFLLRAANIKQAKPKGDIALFPGLAKKWITRKRTQRKRGMRGN